MIEPTTPETKFPVRITPMALKQIKRLIAKDGREGAFLRMGVKGGGCSGLEYVTKLDTERKAVDVETTIEDVTIVCDRKSAVFLDGAVFDYTGNLVGGGFAFQNPNAARSCGCGTSFTPKRS
jgi:iron-sulfur cluster assembly protein